MKTKNLQVRTAYRTFGMVVCAGVVLLLAAISQAQSFLTNGLVAYYPFNGNANDASGNGNNGTNFQVMSTTDRFNNSNSAYSFDGVTSKITAPNAGLVGNVARTITLWAKITDNRQEDFFTLGDGTQHKRRFSLEYGPSLYLWFIGQFDDYGIQTTDFSLKGWQHFCITFSNGQGVIYINGQKVGSFTDPSLSTDATQPLVIGSDSLTRNDAYFYGSIDDVRLYNRALSSSEVSQLYTLESQPPINITNQPSSITNNIGDTVNFTVGVSNANPVTYQWTKDGITLPYGTNATLMISNVQPVNIGNYSVTIADTYSNSVTSSNAMLTLNGVNSDLWQGLVAYYPFNGNANDATGNGNDGTVSGATLKDDRWGNTDSAYYFSGHLDSTGSRIVVTNKVLPLGAAGYTVQVWFNAYSTNNVGGGIFLYGGAAVPYTADLSLGFIPINGPTFLYTLIGGGSSWDLIFDIYHSAPSATAFNQLFPNQWYCETLTKVNTTYSFYINGVLQYAGTNTASAFYEQQDGLILGSDPYNESFYGALDDIRIYNRALSSDDVAQLYTSESTIITNQPSSKTNNIGSAVNFTVGVRTVNPVTFQWLKDGITLNGQTNATITISNAQPVNVGSYSVVISDAFGNSVTSSNAILSLNGVNPNLWEGLVAYYPFNGDTSDVSGNGNDGLATNVMFGLDRFNLPNASGDFNGTNAFVDVPSLSTFQYLPVTYSLWFYLNEYMTPNNALAQGEILVGRSRPCDELCGVLCLYSEPRYNENNLIGYYTGGEFLPTPTSPVIGKWTHLVFTVDTNNVGTFYINSKIVATQQIARLSNSQYPIRIGHSSSSPCSLDPQDYWNGKIDDVRIYNRALSSNDVAALYASESSPPTPQITQDLTNIYAVVGQNTAISVTANSSTPATYQWYFVPSNGGGKAKAYAQTIFGFVYGVVVTNGGFGYGNVPNVSFVGGGGTASGYATVSNGVVTAITVTNTSSGFTSVPSVIIDPPNGLLYGATNSSFTITNADTNSLGNYYVVISNSTGSVTSSVVNLTLLYPPTITQNPMGYTGSLHGSNSLSVAVAGTPPFFYQWLLNGTNIYNATNSSLSISNLVLTNTGSYMVNVSNLYGSTNSSLANVYLSPSLSSPFGGAVGLWGQPVSLNVGAIGSGPLQYQWLFNGTPIVGATNSNYLFGNIQFTNGGLYSVVVSSPYGSVTNTPYQVIVNPANVSIAICPNVVIQGTVGYSYIIQSTTDLSNTNSWMMETNITLTQPIQFWDDITVDTSKSTNPKKFYRVIAGQ